MGEDVSAFIHRFVSAEETRAAPQVATIGAPETNVGTAATLLLLHGTGGDEHDLIPLGMQLAAGAGVNLLSPRGKVSEGGAARFFRRLREGVFDEEDVVGRAHELADFVSVAAARYKFDSSRVIAIGYSNGANIAAPVMMLRPETFTAAILLHAQPVLSDRAPARLDGKKIFLTGGRADPIVPASETERLASLLRDAGATIKLVWQAGGHALTNIEVQEARMWLAASGLLAPHAT